VPTAPLTNLGFGITYIDQPHEIRLAWWPPHSDTGLLLVKLAASGVSSVRFAAGETSHREPNPEGFTCYVLVPYTAAGPTGYTDALCSLTARVAPAPSSFSIRFGYLPSFPRSLVHTPLGGTTGYVRSEVGGSVVAVAPPPPNMHLDSFTLIRVPTCFTGATFSGANIIGLADTLCAIPLPGSFGSS
jgi:hypothetical protein